MSEYDYNFQKDWDYALICGFRDDAKFINVVHLFYRKCSDNLDGFLTDLYEMKKYSKLFRHLALKRCCISLNCDGHYVLPKYNQDVGSVIGSRCEKMFEDLVDDDKTEIDVLLNIRNYKWKLFGSSRMNEISKDKRDQKKIDNTVFSSERSRTNGWNHCK